MFKDGKAYCDYCGEEIIGRCQAHLHRVKKHFCTREHRVLSTLNKVQYMDNYVILDVQYGKRIEKCLIDIDDYENKIKPLGIKINMYQKGYCYFRFSGSGRERRKIKLHRYLMGCHETTYPIIDHINRNPLDNRKCNLRIANGVLNVQNTSLSSNNTSKVKGVSWNKKERKWRGQVQVNGVRIYTHPYKSFEECCKVTEDLRKQMYEEYKNTLDDKLKENW